MKYSAEWVHSKGVPSSLARLTKFIFSCRSQAAMAVSPVYFHSPSLSHHFSGHFYYKSQGRDSIAKDGQYYLTNGLWWRFKDDKMFDLPLQAKKDSAMDGNIDSYFLEFTTIFEPSFQRIFEKNFLDSSRGNSFIFIEPIQTGWLYYTIAAIMIEYYQEPFFHLLRRFKTVWHWSQSIKTIKVDYVYLQRFLKFLEAVMWKERSETVGKQFIDLQTSFSNYGGFSEVHRIAKLSPAFTEH